MDIRSGSNQTDAPKYSIIQLFKSEQADEQANEQPNTQPNAQADEQANEHIITILYSYFIYINNSQAKKFENINESDKKAIVATLRRLDFFVSNLEILHYMGDEEKQDLQLQYWIIKELYFSPYRVYLNKMTRERFLLRFYKSKKYANPNENMYRFLNYAIKSIQQDFCKEKREQEVEVHKNE